MNWMRCIIITIILSLLMLPSNLLGIKDEYFKKAALVRVFSQYIEWPDNSSVKDKSLPFVIGILGEGPINPILEKAHSKKKNEIKGKKVEIFTISQLEEINTCDILFISKLGEFELKQIIEITRDKPILTIGDRDGFAENGVLFNLFVAKEHIGFEVNTSAISESKLKVASELLSVAKIIEPEKDKK
jgi:YfiR/HmsC-like